ncbi:hypothetical protein FZEAL_9704 [Fusarium zealandicum]|uniref:Cystathionine gamma-synthase n=1 Tax=Fusarium zealandicum TaxID=1053134 RepID=A0A8H4U911_9HYPO|nr:hypothetical protein FZEAL_9704 [Fusarium zealandicum]
MGEYTDLIERNWTPHETPQALPVGKCHIHPATGPHAVSSSLPSWDYVIAWSQKDKALLDSVDYSYPRFFIGKPLRALITRVRERLQISEDAISCMVFPSSQMADYCMRMLKVLCPQPIPELHSARFFLPHDPKPNDGASKRIGFSVVLSPTDVKKQAMGVWMDTGAGMSTRHAELCVKMVDFLASDSSSSSLQTPAPLKYPGNITLDSLFSDAPGDLHDLQARVAQLTTSERRGLRPVKAEDVLICPTGMNAIFVASEALAMMSPDSEVVAYGWLYPETVHVLRKSPWCRVVSFKWGTDDELDELEAMLTSPGHQITALFCELPSNIKFISPNLQRIRSIADRHNLIVACDETAGNFINLDILPYVDMILSSLTKMFSGASDVTGGSIVVNPNSCHYDAIRRSLSTHYSSVHCFPSDIAALKRNSANMANRVHKANSNALAVINVFQQHPSVEHVNHASLGPTSLHYEKVRRRDGGYGNVLSVVFRNLKAAQCFYDSLDVCKGSSFGTNFTIAIPYVQLACYWTQDKCEKYGLPRHIIRISVGLENPVGICRKMSLALEQVERLEEMEADQGTTERFKGMGFLAGRQAVAVGRF